jgi:imidazolonepropionase-like amidohydrolase
MFKPYYLIILSIPSMPLLGCSKVEVASHDEAASNSAIVLSNARVIDGTGGPPIDNATIIIDEGRIKAIGSATVVAQPAGAMVVDCRGKTIIPGLISDHSHIGLVNGAKTTAANYTRDNILRQLRQYEAYGITTVTALGLNGPAFYPLREELHAGKAPGADIFGADRGLGVTDGAPPVGWLPLGSDQLDRPSTPEQARQYVRTAAARKPDLIKFWLDDFHGSMKIRMKPDVYEAIIDEAHKLKLRVAAHIYYLADAKALLRAKVDILAHGVRDQPVDAEFVQAMKDSGTWYVPTLGLDESFYIYADQPPFTREPFFLHSLQPELRTQLSDPPWIEKVRNDPKMRDYKDSLRMNLRNLKTLSDAGVHVGFGTDSGATPLRIPGFAEHRELQLIVEAGFTPNQAISMATRNAAALLGLTDQGVLAQGKLADLVILDADPREDIANVQKIFAVWHRGQKVGGPVDEFTP